MAGGSRLSEVWSRFNTELNEIGMLVLFLSVALVIILSSRGLPERTRQVPVAIALLTILLISIRLWRLSHAPQGRSDVDDPANESQSETDSEAISLDDFEVETHVEKVYDFDTIVRLVGLISLFIILIYFMGYLIASFLFIIVMGQYLGEISLRKSVSIALGVTLSIYFVFILILDLPLPQGLFF